MERPWRVCELKGCSYCIFGFTVDSTTILWQTQCPYTRCIFMQQDQSTAQWNLEEGTAIFSPTISWMYAIEPENLSESANGCYILFFYPWFYSLVRKICTYCQAYYYYAEVQLLHLLATLQVYILLAALMYESFDPSGCIECVICDNISSMVRVSWRYILSLQPWGRRQAEQLSFTEPIAQTAIANKLLCFYTDRIIECSG